MDFASIFIVGFFVLVFAGAIFYSTHRQKSAANEISSRQWAAAQLAQQVGWRYFYGENQVQYDNPSSPAIRQPPPAMPSAGWFPHGFQYAYEFGYQGCAVIVHYAEWITHWGGHAGGYSVDAHTTNHERSMVQVPTPRVPVMEINAMGPYDPAYARRLHWNAERMPRYVVNDDGVDGHYRINSHAPQFIHAIFTPDVCRWLVSRFAGTTQLKFSDGVVSAIVDDRELKPDEIMYHAETLVGLVSRIPPQAWATGTDALTAD